MSVTSAKAGRLGPDERARLAAVQRYDILDTPPDGAFDRVASLAARVFDVPIATVTIVDHDRIWFKATHGIDVDEVGRDPGLCASAILQADPYIVTDVIDDPRCFENPLVRGELGVRFYAAAQITTPDGHNLGTVNVIGTQPRQVTAEEIATLQDLADVVADELEVRLAARRTVESERHQRERAERLTEVLQRRLLPQRAANIPGVEVATYYRPLTDELEIGGDFFDVFDVDEERWAVAIGDVCGKGPEAAAVTGEIRYALRAIARMEREPNEVLIQLNDILCRDSADLGDEAAERFCTASLAVIDRSASTATLTLANAGHPLPLIRRVDGSVETAGVPGQLLGPFPDMDLRQTTTALHPGDMALLYTDGAIEQRGISIDVGQRGLAAALGSAPQSSADAALEHIRDAVEQLHGSFNDDIAMVLVHLPA
jgi:sigma-B regulation protein RsbU (phosphoserine phosphatase)